MPNKTGQTFREIFLAFLVGHGIQRPVHYLASRGNVSRSRIYAYFRKLEKDPDPKLVGWLTHEADQIRGSFERNPVEEYFNPGDPGVE